MSQPQPPWNPEDQQGQQPYPGEQYGPSGPRPPQGPYQQQPRWSAQGQPPYIPPGDQQPPYPGPGYGPPQQPPHRSSNSHWVRNILAGIGAVVVVSVVLSHLSSGGTSGSNTAAASAAPVSQATPSPPSCSDQAASWKNSGGLSQFQAFDSDLTALGKADDALSVAEQSGAGLSGAESDVQSTAASLQSDAQVVEANPAPTCVSGLRTDEDAAMADFSKAAADSQNAASEVGSGSYDVANGDMQAATNASTAGIVKLADMIADLKVYQNANG